MLLTLIALAITVSIDSLGIGITYAIRKTKISNISKLILFIMSFLITSLAISIGSVITSILPEPVTKLVGILLLIGMGLWIIYQTQKKKDNYKAKKNSSEKEPIDKKMEQVKKTYNIILKSLGITIQIIRDPISSDLDSSKKIDAKEAFYLGLALSIDSISVGIGSSIIGMSSFFFPLMVATFQLVFLSTRYFPRKKNSSNFKISR